MRNILAAVDFSSVTPAVVETAGRLAAALKAPLWLIHVAAPEPPFVGYEVGPESVRHQVATHIRQEHRQLHELEKQLRERSVEATSLLVQGPTVDKIVEEANRLRADLLVIGSHGHGALYHLVLGSVSGELMGKSPCPLVVVPARAGKAV